MEITSTAQNTSQSQNSETNIIFTFPFPTSVNESLCAIGGRLVKTSKARAFLTKAINRAAVDPIFREYKKYIKQWIDDKNTLRVDCYYIWPKSRLFTDPDNKKAKHFVRQIDASNRTKQLHDALAQIFDVDDMYFFAGDTEKIYDEKYKDYEIEPYCIIKITPHIPRSVNELKEELNLK